MVPKLIYSIFKILLIYINTFTLGFKGRLVDPGRILDEDLQLSETDSD